MQELIETIRAAVAGDATKDQKAAGAAACRTIFAALDTEPGKSFAIPGAPVQAMPRVSIDQVLDLVIARLTTIASEREREAQQALPALTAPAAAPPAPRRLQIPTIAPRGKQTQPNATRPTTKKKQ
jgi:hypothetical protein